jgi:hypothetical protein
MGMKVKDNPHLVGQIALESGFITPEQLDKCVAVQRGDTSKSLGSILVQAGYLSEEQLAEIRRIQDSRFERLETDPARGGLFGQLAVRLGYITPADLYRTLRGQEDARRSGSSLLLGQLLLQRKLITAEQYLELLRSQKKDVASCPACHAFYDLSAHKGGPFQCTSCRAVIRH